MKVNNKGPQSLMNDRSILDVKDSAVKRGGREKNILPSELAESTRINVSPQARQINKATEIAKDQSVDEAKIARLQKMIDGGEYKVDAEAISDRLVNEHLMTKL